MKGEEAKASWRMPPGHGDDVRIYRKHLLQRVLAAVILPFLVFSLLAMIGSIFLGNEEPLSLGKIAGAIVLGGIALVLLWLLLIELTSKITLTDDTISGAHLGWEQMLAHAEIAGRREIRVRGQRALTIVPANPLAKPLRLSASSFATDAHFESWTAGLRDLVAEERKASEARIAGNPDYGATPQERLERLARARTGMNWLSAAAFLVAVWCIVAPWPYLAAVGAAAILPLFAMIAVAASGGLVRFVRLRSEVHAVAGAVPLFSVIALALRTQWDVYLVDIGPALKIGGVAGLALLALAVLADRSLIRRLPRLGIAALVAVTYGICVLVLSDVGFDRSTGQDYRSQILGSRISRSKSVRYFVKLAPWGPLKSTDEVAVSQATFNRLMPGASVCTRLHDGAAGIRWFTISFCAPDTSIPFE